MLILFVSCDHDFFKINLHFLLYEIVLNFFIGDYHPAYDAILYN